MVSSWGLCAPAGLLAQDVESFWSDITTRLSEKDILRTSGALNLRGGFNAFVSSGPTAAARRTAPLTYGATAAVNFDLLGIQAPFTLAYANRNTLYNLPSYTFAGISPTYKWITLHAGDRSMAFSPYSLSGVNFRGGGFQLTPGRWTVAAMRGRLRTESIAFAGADQSGLLLDLKRTGQGVQVGYGGDVTSVEASVFHSRDRVASRAPAEDTVTQLNFPEANLVVTLGARHQFSEVLSAEVEYARSALTRDTEAAALDEPTAAQSLLGLHRANVTTAGAGAFEGTVNFAPSFAKFGVTYERVDPEYETHGSLFIQNDFENITASVAVPLLNSRLNLAARGGLQRNDLRDVGAAQLRRFIGSLQAQIRWGERVQSSFGFSNFNTTNRFRVVDLTRPTVDSVVLAQTQLSLNASTSWMLDAEGTRSLVLTASAQQGRLIRDGSVDPKQGTDFQLASLQYARRMPDAQWGFTAGALFNRTRTPQSEILTAGPTVSAKAAFLDEKLTASLTAGFNARFVEVTGVESEGAATLLTNALSVGYTLTEKQTLQLAAALVKAGDTAALPGYTDTQVDLNYSLRF